MKPAQLIAERFEIDRLAGAGGMGLVYRARDRQTGLPVAVKVMARLDQASLERFDRESRILAELTHPWIVRYVAHGRTPAGQFLAMEWLEGETLADRLLRGRLEVGESVELIERVAGALAAVHARGMVHRDVKPSNLFLVDGSLAQVKLLDFGVALHGLASLTRSVVVGTPGYVAPEQAQGTSGVGPRADVFALGAVLFECLTGRPAFVGGNVMAVLAKILLEEAPRVAEIEPRVPPALDALVARLLAKDPELRPRDAAAVEEELARVKTRGAEAAAGVAPSAITAGEQRLLSVILARLPAPGGWDEPRPEEAWDETRAVDDDEVAEEPRLAAPPAEQVGHEDDLHDRLRAVAEGHGGGLEELADGSLVVTLKGSGAATDQAARAARCALALRALLPQAPIALATGRGMVALRFPVGEAIDEAARLLRQASAHERAVRIDETTAGLLDERFEVGGDRHGLELRRERAGELSPRTLLGKRSSFVGREREIGFLTGIYDECVAEPLARPVIVTAPAGMGKSRLAQELRARLGRLPRPPEVWLARGDPSRAGSPFGMLAPALRRAAGILDGEPLEVRQQKLRARLARHVTSKEELTRVSEFIGELVGARFDGDSVQMHAARRDLLLMGDQMRRAFEDWVAAVAAGGAPLVVILEDLQWGDLPTVKFVDAALRHAHDRPLLVLALARPEVHQLFPGLWAERGVQEMRLGELTRRSSEKLVREALGAVASDEVVARLVARAGGNAFYLEELIRAVAEDRRELPPTVLAMVAARLEQLEPEARRILRAASVFGQVFPRGGLAALLGGERRELGEWLSVLAQREVIRRQKERRFPGEEEYTFRHALVRDAAYALLTEADRALGHNLAAEWLARAGEEDPNVLAEHLAAGPPEGRARAAREYQRAAEIALEGNDFAAALARAEKGLALAGDDGRLLLVAAEAQNWLGEFALAEESAARALALLRTATPPWFRAVAQLGVACARRGNVAHVVPFLAEVSALGDGAALDPEAREAFIEGGGRLANQLILGGRRDLGAALIAQVMRAAETAAAGPAAVATLLGARAADALYAGDPETCHRLSQDAAEHYLAAGSLRLACVHKSNAAFACIEAGALVEAETVLRELLPLALRLGAPNIVASTRHNLGYVLAQRGALDEAEALEREAIHILRAQGDRRLWGSAETYLAYALAEKGDLGGAAAAAARAVDLLEAAPPLRAGALALFAGIRLRQELAPEARALAVRALAVLGELGSLEAGESLVRLMDALTLDALGRRAEARAALAAARRRVLERGEKLGGAWRESFLALRENARILELAAAWDAAT